jgi:hypothetical protein
LKDVYTHTNVQLFDVISDSILSRVDTFVGSGDEFIYPGKSINFKDVNFTVNATLNYVDHDIKFINCHWAGNGPNTIYRCLSNVGGSGYTDGKWVSLINCDADGSYNATIELKSNKCNLRIRDFTGSAALGLPPILMSAPATTINKLEIDGYECVNAGNPISTVVANKRRLNNILRKGGYRDWAYYAETWNIATGTNSISYDLLDDRLCTIPTRDEVSVIPQGDLSEKGISNYWFTISGSVLEIHVDSNSLGVTSFDVKVDLRS